MGKDVQVNGFAAAVVVLGFVQGAYSTEVLRGAILSVPKGQLEAAKAYGMPASLRFRRILFPLMIRYALPGLNNLWVNILKDSSLISVVGLSELLFQSKTAASATKHYFFFYLRRGGDLPGADVCLECRHRHFVERRVIAACDGPRGRPGKPSCHWTSSSACSPSCSTAPGSPSRFRPSALGPLGNALAVGVAARANIEKPFVSKYRAISTSRCCAARPF